MTDKKNQNTVRFSFGHPYPKSLTLGMGSMNDFSIPGPMKVLCWLLMFSILFIAVVLVEVPWVQTSYGVGKVTTLNPAERVQNINALVTGRIAQWYVKDADFVSAGDPLVLIQDIDDSLLMRMQGQLDAARSQYESAKQASATAQIDYKRQERLFNEGLTSRLDFEQAAIRVNQLDISMQKALSDLNQIEVNLSRQGSQLVVAPRDGTILHVEAGDVSTIVNAGQVVASFLPANVTRVVEMYVPGRDVGLIHPGRSARLEFEGWPAFQFSGLPEFAVGTFAGEVVFVEPSARANGSFRVLIAETDHGEGCTQESSLAGMHVAGNCGWPPETYIRLGASVRGWVQLEKVPLGYELWRLMNNFPPVNMGVYEPAGGSK